MDNKIKIKILIINGPNLKNIEKRDNKIYGSNTTEELEKMIDSECRKLNCEVTFFQSEYEGAIIEKIHNATEDFIILNAGAYTHYSIAIRDSIEMCQLPVIEVHISNIYAREEFRQKSVLSPVCSGTITGFGIYGYVMALYAGLEKLRKEK